MCNIISPFKYKIFNIDYKIILRRAFLPPVHHDHARVNILQPKQLVEPERIIRLFV